MQLTPGSVVDWHHVLDLHLRSQWPMRSRITQESFRSPDQCHATWTHTRGCRQGGGQRVPRRQPPLLTGGNDRRRGQYQQLARRSPDRRAVSHRSTFARSTPQRRGREDAEAGMLPEPAHPVILRSAAPPCKNRIENGYRASSRSLATTRIGTGRAAPSRSFVPSAWPTRQRLWQTMTTCIPPRPSQSSRSTASSGTAHSSRDDVRISARRSARRDQSVLAALRSETVFADRPLRGGGALRLRADPHAPRPRIARDPWPSGARRNLPATVATGAATRRADGSTCPFGLHSPAAKYELVAKQV